MDEELPWYLWPLAFLMLCSFGSGPALVMFYGFLNLTAITEWWEWALWLYFGPGGLFLYARFKIIEWLNDGSSH